MLDKGQGIFVPARVWGIRTELIQDFMKLKFAFTAPIVNVLLEGKIVVIKDAINDPLLPVEIAKIFGNRSILYVPMVRREEIIGIVSVDKGDTSVSFEEKDEIFLKGVAHQVSIALDNVRLYRELLDKTIELSRRIETLKVIHEIDMRILSTLDTQELLETAASLISVLIPSDRVTVVLVDKEKQGFVYKAGFGVKIPKGIFVPFKDTSAIEVMRTKRSQITFDLAKEQELPPLEKMLLNNGYHSHIRVPLIVKGKIVGLLNVGCKRIAAFSPDHLSTLESLAAQIAIAIENARLLTDLKELLFGIVSTLSTVMDMKSKWTAGHSERVTKYALAIAREMGMDDKSMRDLELAGLLHDIGKIGTYDVILDKPGKLTEDEIRSLRLHPVKGAEILFPIRQLKDIIPAIKYHHEFYNGKGYPEGLKGKNIPLMARILIPIFLQLTASWKRLYNKFTMKIPHTIKEEHEERHLELSLVIKGGGKTGEIAKKIAELMHPHFIKEERYALPLLGLLPALAKGESVPEREEAIEIAEKFKVELPRMLKEHRSFIELLKKLTDVAKEEKKAEVVTYALKLMLHAQAEEEILYPASILVGEFLKREPESQKNR